jgi:hypothetical protein
MATEAKTPIHKHTHVAYGWIALVVCTLAILGVAGWYYITISDGYNADVVYGVQELAAPPKETSSVTTTEPVAVLTETSAIDAELNNVLDSDLSDTQIDDTMLGIQ